LPASESRRWPNPRLAGEALGYGDWVPLSGGRVLEQHGQVTSRDMPAGARAVMARAGGVGNREGVGAGGNALRLGGWRAAGFMAALEALDDGHAAAAAGTRRAMVASRVVLVGRGGDRGRRHGEEFAGAGEVGPAGSAGEEAVVADAVEAPKRLEGAGREGGSGG
jgi:hypothetical protein